MRVHRLFTALCVAATTVVATPALAADGPTVQGGVTSVVEREDHATATLRDPWDYEEATDVPTDLDFITLGISDASLADGLFTFTADPARDDGAQGGEFSYATLKMMAAPFNSNEPGDQDGALVDAWDGLRYPIDADRLTQVTMRLHSDQLLDTARFAWHTCHAFSNECQGAKDLQIREGWQTLTFDVGPNEVIGYAQEWRDEVINLRLEVSPDTRATFQLDWLRVHEPVADEILIDVHDGGDLFWDVDRDPTDIGEREDRGSGELEVTDGVGRFPVEAFPPGEYHLWTEDGGYGDTITVRALPRPVIDDPDLAGGVDYATERLGNPWDFEDTGDVRRVCNATDVDWIDRITNPTGESVSGVLALTNGRFTCSAPPADRPDIINDPYLEMPLANGGLDPIHYHRVTIDQWFDRAFDLADDSGGGAHGRFIWRTPSSSPNVNDGRHFADGREMVVFSNRTRYSYDMTDTTWGKTSEMRDDAWGDGVITTLRYDPNEDTSDRRSFIDELRIAADDAASPTFDITFHDRVAPAGSTVRLGLDDDRAGYDGELLLDGATLTAGANTVRWNAADLLPQARWVWLEVTSPAGDTSRTYADAILQVDPRISGADRVATAVELSRRTFEDAPAAIVASSANFPDALAAAQLAAAVDGPLLLTPPDALDDRVREELERLGVDRVVVAGGEVAVSAAVTDALATGFDVERIGGRSRYDTAAQLASAAAASRGDSTDTVVVALGTNFPDALAAGPLVTSAGWPLLLVNGTVPEDDDASPIDLDTRAAIDRLDPSQIVVLGGPVAISDEVVAELGRGRDVRRIAGESRFDTARALFDEAVANGADPTDVLVATGRSFPDALGAGAALAARGGTLLLVDQNSVPAATAGVLQARAGNWSSFRVLGGPVAVSHFAVRALRVDAGL